jgi:flagellar protein FliO/FliZ
VLCITAAVPFISAQQARSSGGGASGKLSVSSSAGSGDVVASNGQAQVTDETTLLLDAATPAERSRADPSSFWSIFRTVVALILVAVAVYGVVYFLKRISRPNVSRDPYLKVLASAHLGSNRYVHVVSLGGKAWLVGASEGSVNLIAEVDDEETKDAMLLDDSRRHAAAAPAFSLDFRDLMRKFGAGVGSGAGAESIRKKRERLRGM